MRSETSITKIEQSNICFIIHRFPSKKELVVHEILHKIEKSKPPYPCLVCKKDIDNSDICEMHIDEHSTTLYPCPICEETLPTKLEAVKHLTKHFGDVLSESDLLDISEPPNGDSSIDIIGGILCCFCDDLFKTRTEFDLHFVNEHGDRDLVYTCIICKKQYDKYMMFGNHCHFHLTKNKFEWVYQLLQLASLYLLSWWIVVTHFLPAWGGGPGEYKGFARR